jgi:hypothetical protein
MERRVALRNVAMAMGAIVSLPAWASGWRMEAMSPGTLLPVGQAEVLHALVETIIPKTDTPGASELGVDKFVQKMVSDCYDKNTQSGLASGLSNLDEQSIQNFGKSFVSSTASERLKLVKELEKSDDASAKSFFGLVKNLTIQGYMNSEYVMTNITHYEMVPARYHGCVPVKK